jgi:hypothetical protein
MGDVQCLIAPELRESTAATCVNDPAGRHHVGRVQASSAGPNATTAQHRRLLDQLHRVTLAGNCTRRCFCKRGNEYACDADAECSWDLMRAPCARRRARAWRPPLSATLSRLARGGTAAAPTAASYSTRTRTAPAARPTATARSTLWSTREYLQQAHLLDGSVGGFCKPACGRYQLPLHLQCNLRTTAACAPSGESRCIVRSPFFNGMTQPTTMYCDLSSRQPTHVRGRRCLPVVRHDEHPHP